jgi:hypothetical protein
MVSTSGFPLTEVKLGGRLQAVLIDTVFRFSGRATPFAIGVIIIPPHVIFVDVSTAVFTTVVTFVAAGLTKCYIAIIMYDFIRHILSATLAGTCVGTYTSFAPLFSGAISSYDTVKIFNFTPTILTR